MSATCPRLGFAVQLTFSTTSAAIVEQQEAFLALLSERDLTHVGVFSGTRWRLSIWREGSQVDDMDRQAVRAWTTDGTAVLSAHVGEINDLDED